MKTVTIEIEEKNEEKSNKVASGVLGESTIYSGIINMMLSLPASVIGEITKLCSNKQIEIGLLDENLKKLKLYLPAEQYDEAEAYRILSYHFSTLYEELNRNNK